MKKIMNFTILLCLSLLCLSCGNTSPDIHVPDKEIEKYDNPIISKSAPDPSIIFVEGKGYYLYTTEDIRNMPIFHSIDLVAWTQVGTVFTNATRPSWETGGSLWAPDINYISGKYVLYYSMAIWDAMTTSGVGVAVADKPEGPFTDLGPVLRSNTIGVINSIDPCYIEDGGKKYLFWGSYHGIYGIELNNDGLSIKSNAEKRQVADVYEGTYIHKRGKYYYLFGSVGTCCERLKSTYTTVVGRSENLWGPYVDKQGRSMMQNHHEIVIQGNSYFVGTGHNSEIVQDGTGNDWILYHAYNVTDEKGRNVMLDHIQWINDWPTIAGNSPSTTANSPEFK
jgi:arabinan endo-1,5-alpha-L-arabinosidase